MGLVNFVRKWPYVTISQVVRFHYLRKMKKMTKEEAQKLKDTIDWGYHNRDDYPPFALTPWDDRNRYREYVFKIIDESVKDK